MKELIKNKASVYQKDIVGFRRHIHMYPELSFNEKKTSAFIAGVLKKHKIKFSRGWAEHGILAHVGKSSNRDIVLRADMDALPIQEENKVAYKSKNEGIMHACGHDVHSSSLLGAAIILKQIEKELPGQISFIFQPGEEKLPGGASILIKEGLFKQISAKSIIGQHVHPPLQVGKVGFKAGPYMASADEIFLEVEGKGGHGALPHSFIDPVYISAQILTALQSVVARSANPNDSSVLSFGKINSDGGASNVIPNRVLLEGTFRTMNETWRKEAHKLIRRTCVDIAKALGGRCNVDIKVGYPALINDIELTERMRANAIEYLGKRHVVDLPKRMTAEDFSYYSQMMPACFYRLGTGNKKKGIVSSVHSSTFDIDESALSIGAGLMAYNAYKEITH